MHDPDTLQIRPGTACMGCFSNNAPQVTRAPMPWPTKRVNKACVLFRRGAIETLRLPGVSRPEPFRQTCLKVRQSYVSVAAVRSA